MGRLSDADRQGSSVRAYTRNGYDWTTRYWPITLTASVMPFKSGIIDGEVVVLDEQHRSSFNELQGELSGRRASRLVFVAFDLLHWTAWTFASCRWWCGGSAWSGWCRQPTAVASSSARRSPDPSAGFDVLTVLALMA